MRGVAIRDPRRHSMPRLRIFEFADASADETRRARIRARVVT
jgi:hypothetical protein